MLEQAAPDGPTPPPASDLAWTWRGGSEPRDLVLEPRPTPRPGEGEVLVRNEAVGLNPVDWKVLGGELVDWLPGHAPGVDGAGTVVALGEGVPGDWLGRRVAYHQSLDRPGSFAEHTPLRAEVLMRVPDGLDAAIAAGLPCPALTAWLALDKLPARPGSSLLVSGAGGAVGRYLVQFAAAQAWRVTAMCHPRHWDRLSSQGAAECRPGPLPGAAPWPDGEAGHFAVVVDCVGPEHAARLAPALAANGHLVCVQGRVERWPTPRFGRALSLHEVALGALHRQGDRAAWKRITAAGEGMLQAVAAGHLAPEPLVERPFAELPRLLEALRHRAFFGKPVARLPFHPA